MNSGTARFKSAGNDKKPFYGKAFFIDFAGRIGYN